MSSFSFHGDPKSLPPFVDSILNNILRQAVACVSQALLQISQVSNWCLINTILHNISYLIVYGLKVRIFGGHKSGTMNFGVFTLKDLDRMRRTMRWCTVLLEYVSIASTGTYGWQRLRHQYDVAIITAVNLSAMIDENKAPSS